MRKQRSYGGLQQIQMSLAQLLYGKHRTNLKATHTCREYMLDNVINTSLYNAHLKGSVEKGDK